ncbi:hypothetical protein BD289DRAFT_423459 [Coniella lustricola]|uniref:Uncharacterized protein n=1 Tax=Coniella lustricola TaxID=2025994 RepID=A0A2T3AJU1_9PEZI|nr:hypothetical protein BD289DRAFT_423459 [Coniella lustricola]
MLKIGERGFAAIGIGSVGKLIDPEQVWLDLCQPGPTRRQAISRRQNFLRVYVVTRKRRVVYLGPEEYKMERTIRSACTLEASKKDILLILRTVWRRAADIL